MKNLFKFSAILILAISLNAQAQQFIAYQGVARNSAGNILVSQPIGLRLSILSGSATGTSVYVETHARTTDAYGMFTLQIGQGTVVSGLFSTINWGTNTYFLKVEIDPTGGTNYGLAGTTQFASVPYALYSSNGTPSGQTTGDLLYWNGTAWVMLHPGSVGQVLTINASNMPVWQSGSGTVATAPQLTTTAVSSILNTSAISGGNITSDGGFVVTARGVCWAIGTTPTITDSKTTNGSGGGSFTSNITGLLGSTTYNVRAYATNSTGTGYGLTLSFTTAPATLPTLTTTLASNITGTTAGSGGNITNNGGANVTARGVCWSTSSNPTIANTKTTDSLGSGTFTSNLTGLSPGTTYYVRAYATNSAGTAYGTQQNFTTLVTLPTITTTSTTAITSNTATSGGNISSSGGAWVSARGVCWSITGTPTIETNNKTTDGSGSGTFTSSITGLLPNTLYHLRSYATNSAGTAYGNEVSFTTTNVTTPTLTTSIPSNIASTIALCGGNITNSGGSDVTSRGVCWSTSANPTIALSTKTVDGSGSGFFTSLISGLIAGTTYNVRAYATSSMGTSYGAEQSFTTSSQIGIGDPYQGGKIAYIFQDGFFVGDPLDPFSPGFWEPGDPGFVAGEFHGIIAAPSDQSTGAEWGCEGTYIGTGCSYGGMYDCTKVGQGFSNTELIVMFCSSPGIAAKICSDLVLNGYNDWFLPSKIELYKLYESKILVGGYTDSWYWSSSEGDLNDCFDNAFGQSFYTGYTPAYITFKSNLGYVRAVRNF